MEEAGGSAPRRQVNRRRWKPELKRLEDVQLKLTEDLSRSEEEVRGLEAQIVQQLSTMRNQTTVMENLNKTLKPYARRDRDALYKKGSWKIEFPGISGPAAARAATMKELLSNGFVPQTEDGDVYTFNGALEDVFDVDEMTGIVNRHGGYPAKAPAGNDAGNEEAAGDEE